MISINASHLKYIQNMAASAIQRAQDQHLPAVRPFTCEPDRWPGFRLEPAASGFQHQGQSPRQGAAACVEDLLAQGWLAVTGNGRQAHAAPVQLGLEVE